MKAETIVNCTGCQNEYDKNEVARTLGKDSLVYMLDRCSTECHHKTNWEDRIILTK